MDSGNLFHAIVTNSSYFGCQLVQALVIPLQSISLSSSVPPPTQKNRRRTSLLLSPVAEKPSYATEIQLWLEHRATPAKLLSELRSPVICLENNSSPKLNCDC